MNKKIKAAAFVFLILAVSCAIVFAVMSLTRNSNNENNGETTPGGLLENIPTEPLPESTPEESPKTEPEGPVYITYKEYLALSGSEKKKYFESFGSPEAFFEWQNQAESVYVAEQSRIEIGGDETIDMDDIFGGG